MGRWLLIPLTFGPVRGIMLPEYALFPREPIWLDLYIVLISVCVFTHRNIMFIYIRYRKNIHFIDIFKGYTFEPPSFTHPRSHSWFFATLYAFLSLRERRISIAWRTIGSYSTRYSVTTVWCPMRECSLSGRILRVEGTLARLLQPKCYLHKWCCVKGLNSCLSKTNLVTATCVSCYRTFGFSSKKSFKNGLRRRISNKEACKAMYAKCYKHDTRKRQFGVGVGGEREPQRLWMPMAGVGQNVFSLLKLSRRKE